MAVFIAMTRFTALLLKLSVFPISVIISNLLLARRYSHFFDAKEHMYNLRISGRACCALAAGQIYYKDILNMIPKFNHCILSIII